MSDAGARAAAGAVAGGSLAAAVAASSYVGWQLFALPFPPFDLFDWLARELPGWLVTFWIDSVVIMLRWMHTSSTARAAKSAEQVLAITVLLAAGAAVGAAVFVVLRFSEEPASLLGVVVGGAFGAGTVLVESGLQRLGAPWHIDAFWIVATFLAWGLGLGQVHDHWRGLAREAVSAEAPGQLDRRRFLSRVAWLATVPAAMTAVAALVKKPSGDFFGFRKNLPDGFSRARWSDTHPLPNADAPVQPVPGTRPEFTPLENHYRIDINTRTPSIDAARWRLAIGGLVEHPIAFTLGDLRSEEQLEQFITLACISNPLGGDLIGTTRWTGVSVRRLLTYVGAHREATHLKVRAADGFFEIVPLDLVRTDPRVMLAYAWDGVPLLAEHGFPLRLYIPDVYGMKQPKWIESLEAVNHWEPGYWVERGWDKEGRMAATSVIDAVRGQIAGGIAHAGSRGISRVEVRVDDGPWTNARLRDSLSQTTWVVWRADIPGANGSRTISVRCYDGTGHIQSPPYHMVRLTS